MLSNKKCICHIDVTVSILILISTIKISKMVSDRYDYLIFWVELIFKFCFNGKSRGNYTVPQKNTFIGFKERIGDIFSLIE